MGKCQTRLANLAHDNEDEDLQLKPTMVSSDDSVAEAPPSALSIFHEDILLSILSYVADVPFEMVDDNGQ